MLLVEQGSDDGIQTYRLSLASCTRYEQMRYLREVHHVNFVGDSLAKCDRQFHLCLLELAWVENALHRHYAWLSIRNLDTDGALAGDGSDDTNAKSRKTECDIVFKSSDFRYSNAFSRCYFIKRDGRTYGCTDRLYLHAEWCQHVNDTFLVRQLLVFIYKHLASIIVFLEQVKGRVLVSCPRLFRIYRSVQVNLSCNSLASGLLIAFTYSNLDARIVGWNVLLRFLIAV